MIKYLFLMFVLFAACDNEIENPKKPVKFSSFSSSDGKFTSSDPEVISNYVDGGDATGCGRDSNGRCYCCYGGPMGCGPAACR